jgi:hypothetical protein
VLVAQDTTTFEYHTHLAAEGLGPINDSPTTRGFFAHTALALTPDGLPLGLLSAHFWTRDLAELGKAATRRSREPAEKESRKWRDALRDVEQTLPPSQPLLLIQDREADIFDFLAAPRRPTTDLLVRASQPRRVQVPALAETPSRTSEERPAPGETEPTHGTLFDLAATAPVFGTVEVRIPRQSARPQVAPHLARTAQLTVRVRPLIVQPPCRKGVRGGPQTLWVVQAVEAAPPPGVTPVSWVLLTSLPVLDLAAAQQILTYYKRRWQIERLHYTVKSGCGAEQLHWDRATTLQNAVALYFVVAWRLLYLTHVAREAPGTPAATLLNPVEQQVLAQRCGRPVTNAREVVRAVAQLGGWEAYRKAPPPGVKVIWLGLRQLQALVEGWELAMALMNQG